MAKVTEIARINGRAYGVAFVVCRNSEVARLALELEDNEVALSMMDSAGREISDAGFDFDYCSDFRAYNGGPRVGLVDAIYYVADLSYEGEIAPPDADCDLEDWRETWQRGAGSTEIPAEVKALVDAVLAEV